MRSRMLRITIWALVALILIIVLVLGLRRFAFGMDLSGAGFTTTYSFSGSEAFEKEGAALPANTAISALELEWIAGEADILFYGGDQISFEETAPRALSEKETLRYRVSNGKLTIHYCEPKTGINRFSKMPEKSIKIMIPKYLSGMDITAESISASVSLDGGGEVLGALSIESVSGAIRITDAYASSVHAGSVSGSILFEGISKKTDVETVSGSVTLDFFETPKNLKVDSVSGGISVKVAESSGFTATLESMSGKLTCSFAEMLGSKKAVYRDGEADFRFATISGSVVISLLQGKPVPPATPVAPVPPVPPIAPAAYEKAPESKPSDEEQMSAPEKKNETPASAGGRKF